MPSKLIKTRTHLANWDPVGWSKEELSVFCRLGYIILSTVLKRIRIRSISSAKDPDLINLDPIAKADDPDLDLVEKSTGSGTLYVKHLSIS